MNAFTDILKGERGLFGVLLVIAVTIFVGMDKITFAQWQDYTLWIFAVFVGGKTVTTSVGLIASRNDPVAVAPGVGAPTPTPTPTP